MPINYTTIPVWRVHLTTKLQYLQSVTYHHDSGQQSALMVYKGLIMRETEVIPKKHVRSHAFLLFEKKKNFHLHSRV